MPVQELNPAIVYGLYPEEFTGFCSWEIIEEVDAMAMKAGAQAGDLRVTCSTEDQDKNDKIAEPNFTYKVRENFRGVAVSGQDQLRCYFFYPLV